MNYTLALELKNAGFPQNMKWGDAFYDWEHHLRFEGQSFGNDGEYHYYQTIYEKGNDRENCKAPSLSELIEECGTKHPLYKEYEFCLVYSNGKWCSGYMNGDMQTVLPIGKGSTPEEAVTKLFLALNKK